MSDDGERVSRRRAWVEETGAGNRQRTREQIAQHLEWSRTGDLRALAGCRCRTCEAP